MQTRSKKQNQIPVNLYPQNYNYNYNNIYNGMTGWNVADSGNNPQWQVNQDENVAFYPQGIMGISFSEPYIFFNVPSTLSSYTNDAGFLGDAPYDGTIYGRQNGSWVATGGGGGGSGINSGLRYTDSYGSYGGSTGQAFYDGGNNIYANRYGVSSEDNYNYLSTITAGDVIIYHSRTSTDYIVFYVYSNSWNGTYFTFYGTTVGGTGSVSNIDVGMDFVRAPGAAGSNGADGMNGSNGMDGMNGTNGKYVACVSPLYEYSYDTLAIYQVSGANDGYVTSLNYADWYAKLDDAPYDGNYYVRQNSAWVVAPFIPEAPADGNYYTRKDNTWVAVPVDTLSAVLTASSITPIMDGTYTFDVSAPNTTIAIDTVSGIITNISIA